MPSSSAYGGEPTGARRRRPGLAIIIIVIVVVIVLVVGIIAYEAYTTSSPPIQVPYVNIWAPTNVCGLNSNPISYYGDNWSTSSALSVELLVPNFNSTACTIHSVTTNTTGFTLSGVQVPLTIPAMGNESMNLTVTSPGSSYSGDLNLIFL